ncbi:type VI secretion system accessory protein TagJ [Fuerstiella marisgermanici]|uniref:Protein of avirulence locus involved in temperature-dependent protein secretion n=1 Tax=Fuerstiella marisgermanici TaxID=1891926 RepID=A0A1P8WE74_9PLAN|nr:type VI secretion system accessory protein TagJ [Fuerstiella marisgermanici]APZ92329.1 Protein of avirulence locus involved in temperature-dependent protein secretion [Fuerstiella marisgermanici]
MTTPVELFQAGKLTDAVAAANEAVRNDPSSVVPRSQLAELLCFDGNLERADKQLDATLSIDPDSLHGTSLLRHLIRSEMSRREVYEEGRIPEFLSQPTDAQQKRLKALLNLRDGDFAGAAQLLAEASELEPEVTGTLNGKAFEGMRDLDDLLGPTIEVYTATGQYYWLSIDQIKSIELSDIEHLSDMLWRAAEIETVGEVAGRIHIPALYHGSHTSEDERIRIGRATDWKQQSEDAPVQGSGQREWLVGEDAVTITEVKTITIGD